MDRPRSSAKLAAASAGLLLACLFMGALVSNCAVGCATKGEVSIAAGASSQPPPGPSAAGSASCPATAKAPSPIPGTRSEHETLAYWLARYPQSALDAPLMTEAQISAYNAALGRRPGDSLLSQRDLLEPVSRLLVERDLDERFKFLRERAQDGRLLDANGQKLGDAILGTFVAQLPDQLTPELRVALAEIPMRCGPYAGPLYEPNALIRYDRNACSAIHAKDPVVVLAPFGDGLLLVQTRYARAFIARDAALSPPVPKDQAEAVVRGARAPARPLTRRALLTEAFSFLGSPYGFGDAGGGRDCSRLMLDLFERFDLALPRHSGWQAQAGAFSIDASGLSENEKRSVIREASKHGAVMLAFPGHIMLHLGEREDGTPMVLHALGEYVVPCANGQEKPETVYETQRVIVSDLELGRGSARKALIERITSVVVLGDKAPEAFASRTKSAPPPPPTAPAANAPCSDDLHARIFPSPQKPEHDRPLRVIATGTTASAASELWLFDPQGAPVHAAMHRLGGPPYSVWLELPEPVEGRYSVLWTDGGKTLACKRIAVRVPQRPLASESANGSASVWEPRFRWEADTNNLWAAFVEQLFDGAPDDERTWTSLHTLLRDPERNLLHDHFGLGEDAKLELVPDCADLPFALRAYFAWKLKLPFAYRRCSRGRSNVPPTCGALNDTTIAREAPDELGAFDRFVNRGVRSGVHSASGRTHPDDSATDLYPVALDRASLTPGTVFADPYGHTLILTKWFDQGFAGPKSYGILIAAEAQPDNTVGRRRFARGSFLFDPSTVDVGAGFKHFRPLVFERAEGAPGKATRALDNKELESTTDHTRFSLVQYQGSRDDFYDRMDALINPRPLDPSERLRSLLDGFEEAVKRRVLSVDTGEEGRAGKTNVIPMPIGHEVFETVGDWEDFSTPSRDLRLLIALDELLGLPKRVATQPERFALSDPKQAGARSLEIQGELSRELSKRTFTYTRSDGTAQTLPLSAVMERAAALELAYNPNDCPELRWGAPEGSDELASCARRAPADQRAKMERYRVWFHNRTRPARGARNP